SRSSPAPRAPEGPVAAGEGASAAAPAGAGAPARAGDLAACSALNPCCGRVSPVAGGPPRSNGPATYVQYDSAVLGRRAALTTAIRALATGFTAHPDPRSLGLRARYALQAASSVQPPRVAGAHSPRHPRR